MYYRYTGWAIKNETDAGQFFNRSGTTFGVCDPLSRRGGQSLLKKKYIRGW